MSQALRVATWVPTADPPAIGDGIATSNPSNPQKVITTVFQLMGGAGSGVSEAPSDGNAYVRLNATWVPLDPLDGGTF